MVSMKVLRRDDLDLEVDDFNEDTLVDLLEEPTVVDHEMEFLIKELHESIQAYNGRVHPRFTELIDKPKDNYGFIDDDELPF